MSKVLAELENELAMALMMVRKEAIKYDQKIWGQFTPVIHSIQDAIEDTSHLRKQLEKETIDAGIRETLPGGRSQEDFEHRLE